MLIAIIMSKEFEVRATIMSLLHARQTIRKLRTSKTSFYGQLTMCRRCKMLIQISPHQQYKYKVCKYRTGAERYHHTSKENLRYANIAKALQDNATQARKNINYASIAQVLHDIALSICQCDDIRISDLRLPFSCSI